METPQEIEVWYILPAIRKEIAQAMANKGLKQVEIADFLGITKSAVNHYLKQKRARELIFPPEIKQEIEKSVDTVLKNKQLLGAELQRLCEIIRKCKYLCKVHHKFTKEEISEKCRICIQGV